MHNEPPSPASHSEPKVDLRPELSLPYFDRPSSWLRSGFVRYEHRRGWTWSYVQADRPIQPWDQSLDTLQVDALFSHGKTRAFLVRLTDTFEVFLPITAAEWELDLRQSPYPETLLRLWEAVLGVYTYYVVGKKLPVGATTDYLLLILDFSNTGAADFLSTYQLRSLTPARVTRVIGELGRWFRREGSL